MVDRMRRRGRTGLLAGGLVALGILVGGGLVSPARAATGPLLAPSVIQDLVGEGAIKPAQYYYYGPRRRYYARPYYRRYYARPYYPRRYYRPRYYYRY